LLLTGSICDCDIVAEICILMLHTDKILQINLCTICNDGRQC